MTGIQPTMLRPATPRPAWQTAVGLVLVLPAFVLLLTSYVEPAVWTFRSSFNRFTGLRFNPGGEGAGFDNYAKAFDVGLGGSLLFGLSLAAVPLALVLLLAPALAWAAARTGRAGRWVVRALLTIPLAAFAPMAVALAYRARDLTGDGRPEVRPIYWLGTFGLVSAAGVVVYLAAFRRRDATRSPWPAVGVTALLAVLAVIAAGLQEFTYSYIEGFGTSPAGTPARLMFDTSFRTRDFGVGAAVSATVLLPLMLFGLAATVIIVLTGLRLEVDRSSPEPAPAKSPTPWVVGGILLVVVLVGTGFALWPWLSDITNPSPVADPTWGNTWLPPLVSTLVGVTAAALAAFGISGLRPLGRHSEWLLLPFGLFLFVGIAPLALRAYAAGATAGRLNSFIGLISPSRVAIPALFILALVFRGQALRREALRQENRPAPWSSLVLPALPMLGLAYLVTWVVQAQNLLWPLISATSRHMTAHLLLVEVLQTFDLDRLPYGRLLPLPMLLLFLLLGVAAQLWYLDRVALRVGLPERDHPPRT
ncbi:sugar ABC transporter permease [Dactylosporangium roseum]|uniref:Sugar ABC transporter permease n=1 Tax=Dactylosporangium roseum TaxID=47989 RepID=A0ABY5Z3C6_9ACTN|nr:sugar ABC transporter permease [Dactylosporangium roseum]UWZ36521.1 sugar ABC transporter permease [Dactylosporangium roseum]